MKPSSLLILAAGLALVAGPALADARERLAPAFSGTVVSTYPDGRTGRLWLSEDGTYRGRGRRGGASSGRWRINGEQICLTQRRPIPVPRSYCTPVPESRSSVGRAPTGERITIRVVPGGRS